MKESSTYLDIEPTKSTDIAFFCYTSGTTGNPKGAVHLHHWVPGNDPSILFWQNALEPISLLTPEISTGFIRWETDFYTPGVGDINTGV